MRKIRREYHSYLADNVFWALQWNFKSYRLSYQRKSADAALREKADAEIKELLQTMKARVWMFRNVWLLEGPAQRIEKAIALLENNNEPAANMVLTKAALAGWKLREAILGPRLRQ